MRYITIPPTTPIEGAMTPAGKPAEITFTQFVRNILVGHGEVTKNDENLRLFMEMADQVKTTHPGDVWELNGPQHELLSQMARTYQYAADFKISILSFIRAITSAPEKAPEKTSEKASEKPAEKSSEKAPEASDAAA